MSVTDTIKNNSIKVLLGTVTSIITVVVALFTLDSRYAHAADVAKDKAHTERIIQETTRTLRQQMIEDKLFELDVKSAQSAGRLSPVDTALRERYKRQLDEIVRTQRSTK